MGRDIDVTDGDGAVARVRSACDGEREWLPNMSDVRDHDDWASSSNALNFFSCLDGRAAGMNEPHVPFSVEYIFALSMRSLVSARRPRLVGLGDGRGRFEGGPRASRFRSTYMPDIWLDGREMD